MKINPIELFFWTFRRNERDVVNLYDALSDIMRLATNGNMLNFGFWDASTHSPLAAQSNLCTLFGKMSKLENNQIILDVGSGFGSPAIQWNNNYEKIDLTCININNNQLHFTKKSSKRLNLINATATKLPVATNSIDKVLALESAQHFKPIENFLSESKRILKKTGLLAIAMPIMTENSNSLLKLGLLSMTWSSEHYSYQKILSLLQKTGFTIVEKKLIGSHVYDPLADYYIKNRNSIKEKIQTNYSTTVENILYHSLLKMKKISQKKVIDYLLLVCSK